MSAQDSTESPIVIQLTQGQSCVIDAQDADLAMHKWYACKDRPGFYAVRGKPRGKGMLRMHRVILERILGRPLLQGEVCDHIDTDTLNNRRSNLRLASYAENQINRGCTKSNTSGYKGVSWHKSNKKWRAVIGVNGGNVELGYYDTIEAAAEAYKAAVAKYFGAFGRWE